MEVETEAGEGCREVAGAGEWGREGIRSFGVQCCLLGRRSPELWLLVFLLCACSPLGWSCRDKYILAPHAVSWLHYLFCSQQQPLCVPPMIYSRGQSLPLPFPNAWPSVGTLGPGTGIAWGKGWPRPSSLQCVEPVFKLFFNKTWRAKY